jgi:hypothetical protein
LTVYHTHEQNNSNSIIPSQQYWIGRRPVCWTVNGSWRFHNGTSCRRLHPWQLLSHAVKWQSKIIALFRPQWLQLRRFRWDRRDGSIREEKEQSTDTFSDARQSQPSFWPSTYHQLTCADLAGSIVILPKKR